ncbi:MAG: CoA-binding protein [Candidatus Peribacteraceae bacterium]|nr:CoA-binding protein [Candidatus Peribacteraceae bacterium]
MSLLHPASIAVIGASAEETKVGHMVLKNIVTQGFKGKLYPVNPKGGEILGMTVCPSVTAIDGKLDLAVIVTPGKTVPALLDECGKKGVKTVIVISAGFGETGTDEGHALEKDLIRIAKQYGIDLVGPNCLGVIRPSIGMNASFAENVERAGSIALLSQSGALAVALLDAAASFHMDFSLVVSMGNKAAMNECDFLELCRDDPETKVIGLYLESIQEGARFLHAAAEIVPKKPIVLIKSGVSERGKKAVSSHTGALAGSDAAINAVCSQTGIHRAHTTEEFLDLLRTLSTQPNLLTPHIAVITNAGGPGILATDAAERENLVLAELEPKNADALKKQLPAAASVKNPIDVLGDAVADRYAAALIACAKDPNIDGVAALLTPQVMTPCAEIAQAVIDVHAKYPLMPIVTSFMGEKNVKAAITLLQANGVPNFSSPERAVAALAALHTHNESRIMSHESRIPPHASLFMIPDSVHGLLSEEKTSELFKAYDLPLPSSAVATSADEAVKLAEQIGYPVVAKISSPEIIHKTDIGCVRVNITSSAGLRPAFEEIMANAKKNAPKATLNGVLIQQMLPAGDEFIVGAIKDPNFGHLVMTGLGGIYTELFRDTAFRIAPIGENDAYEMLQELRSWKMLLGLRGKSQSDIVALAKIIAQISHLVTDCPQIKELDLNPVIVRSDGVVIADAKVILE